MNPIADGIALGLGRRDLLAAFAGFALLGEVRAPATAARSTVARWIARQQEIAVALGRGALRPRDWMTAVEGLAREVDVAELMATVARGRVTDAGRGSHNDPAKRVVRFVGDDGAPRRLAYGVALFDFDPANVVTPHAHRNMVSAHLVVAGALRVRTFDRLGEEGEGIAIRPTGDRIARMGQVSTMSGDRDNIHWFVPVGGPATSFDVVVSGIDPAAPDHEISAVDPLGGRRRGDGAIVAPRMSFAAAADRYTADV